MIYHCEKIRGIGSEAWNMITSYMMTTNVDDYDDVAWPMRKWGGILKWSFEQWWASARASIGKQYNSTPSSFRHQPIRPIRLSGHLRPGTLLGLFYHLEKNLFSLSMPALIRYSFILFLSVSLEISIGKVSWKFGQVLSCSVLLVLISISIQSCFKGEAEKRRRRNGDFFRYCIISSERGKVFRYSWSDLSVGTSKLNLFIESSSRVVWVDGRRDIFSSETITRWIGLND